MTLEELKGLLQSELLTLESERKINYNIQRVTGEELALWVNQRIIGIFKREKNAVMGVSVLVTVKRESLKTKAEAELFLVELLRTWKMLNT